MAVIRNLPNVVVGALLIVTLPHAGGELISLPYALRVVSHGDPDGYRSRMNYLAA